MIKKYAALIAYLATIPLANWFINNVGTQSFPEGPHTIPVGFGYQAPSGVLLIGIALLARDYVQEKFGKKNALIAIAAGIAISFFVNPDVATASAVAFAASEIVDFFVYTRIKRKSLTLAVIFSGVVGGIIDSFLFLRIAFGSTDFWQGQVIGKTWMALLGGLIIWGYRALSHRLHPQEA
jgi:uncharacterized PurR-regulated membrane protein YhhQ (DUF165 family)